MVAHSHSADFDEPYSYDGLNQLTDMQRGSYSTAPVLPSTPPSGFSSTPTLQQTWSLDSTGNWTDFTEVAGITTTLVQTRKANRVNEITEITNSTGGGWQQPVYDAAGNMTLMPQPASPGDGFAAVYDAWNRLVRIDDVSGESPVTVQENAYDGLTRRVSKTTFGDAGEIRHYYYDIDWRVIEEYVGATPNRSNREDWDRVYAWGLRYIDELALRLRAMEGEDPEALVPLQDANWNVTAICDGTAAVVERYSYTAYGTPTFQDETFAPLGTNASAYNWDTLYCGYRWDNGPQLYLVRYRFLNSLLGSWLAKDFREYSSWPNLFRYVGSRPISFLDPLGLEGIVIDAMAAVAYNNRVATFKPASRAWLPDILAETQSNYSAAAKESFKLDSKVPSDPKKCPKCVLVWVPGYILTDVAEGQTADFKAVQSVASTFGDPQIYGFMWNSNPGTAHTIDHLKKEYRSIEQAARDVVSKQLLKFLTDFRSVCKKSTINIGAHSTGAAAVLEALRNENGLGINTVLLAQAAVPATTAIPLGHANRFVITFDAEDPVLGTGWPRAEFGQEAMGLHGNFGLPFPYSKSSKTLPIDSVDLNKVSGSGLKHHTGIHSQKKEVWNKFGDSLKCSNSQ